MRSWTLAAVGLLSVAVEAAPRQVLGDELEARDAGLELVGVVGGIAPRSQHGGAQGEADGAMAVPEGCPTGTVFVSTTTIDVTVYVTATNPAVTEPCLDDETITVTPVTTTTTTEPCPEETGAVTVKTVITRNPYANLTSTTTVLHTPTAGGDDEPCDPETVVSTGSLTIILSTTTPPRSPSTTATEPCDDETVTTTLTASKTATVSTTTTEPCSDETTTGLTTHMTLVTKPPAKTAQTTTICVIDTAMTPVTKTTLTVKPPATVVPTKTVYAHDKATGRPSPESAYCGVKGEPAGTYFIAEFIEDRPGVPVTEEGCYQFCDSVMEDTKGCKAYRYYPNDLGAPRCKLYGMPVSYDVRDIDNHQPGMWYDLACGPPSARSRSSQQKVQKMQRPQVQDKFTSGKTEGASIDTVAAVDDAKDKAKNKAKDKVQDHHEGTHSRNSTSSGVRTASGNDNDGRNPGSIDDTMNTQPDMKPIGGNDSPMDAAQPEMPTGGSGNSSPIPGAPVGGTPKKGSLLGLGLGVSPLRR
ncbi:hypothetical protein HRG_005865 [Hirsutella rhossiliensis]|uniref:Apple domain-containing protein n=1 Tax=Hirsutella rhossiliensis TaxID=111463 RepID=A0A9P8MY10_9HYPO|nr:uncharacterized protein HRG_05865 [Hirsutella rhossiliensis]KAH0963355.1 hypothetical protein HRG_05865 [Hirsutella rhossiliensis]